MATQSDALAQVYARSLYELAEDAGGQEKIVEVGNELEQICELTREHVEFREFLASPIIEHHRRGAALGRIFRDQITDLTLRFLLVLNEKGRLARLESINTAYDQLVQDAYGRVEVDVYTAKPIDEPQLAVIEDRIQQALNRKPVLYTYTDDAMLGGIRLRIGDRLIDGSVATRLRRLRQSLMTSGASAVRARTARIIEEGRPP